MKLIFVQTGASESSVDGTILSRLQDRFRCLMLLFTLSYGLINANFKFGVHSDDLFLECGRLEIAYPLPLIYEMINGRFAILKDKTVDKIPVTGGSNTLNRLSREVNGNP